MNVNLTAFSISNFKAFAASQRIPLRPITLIYGANSVGKSSAIHALTLAHHAIETGDLDTHRTEIGGESIDLGGFRQYVHRREQDREVELGFELDPTGLVDRLPDSLGSTYKIEAELAIGEEHGGARQASSGDRTRGVGLKRFVLKIDDAELLSMSARRGGLMGMNRIDHEHPVLRDLFRLRLLQVTETREYLDTDVANLPKMLRQLVPNITATTRGIFPRINKEFAGDDLYRSRREDTVSAIVPIEALSDLIACLGTAFEDEVGRLRYLGPLRSYPPRHHIFSQHEDPNRYAGGGYAWDVVRDDPEVRRRVNRWLGDSERLKTPYELQVSDLLPADLVSREVPARLRKVLHDLLASLLGGMDAHQMVDLSVLARQLAERIAELDPEDEEDLIPDIEELVSSMSDEDELSERWVEEMVAARSDALRQLVLIDKRTSTPVSHRDVGIGVSQVLPVLVSAYASNNKHVAIEQPEIYLHPALQAELGDVFLQSALGDCDNTFLIETHSEHLLLRIMRRMRETGTGELPDGVPAVHPDDVMVLFVEPDGTQSIVRQMPLNERGELVKAWPGGFFEEGIREIF